MRPGDPARLYGRFRLDSQRDERLRPRSDVYSSTLDAPVLLLGSAHVVDLSEPLRRVLAERVLDAVAVELDAERAESLMSPDGPGRRTGSSPLFARLWGVVQRRLGAEIGAGVPGAEMKVAIEVARGRDLPVFLIDDPIRATLANLVRSLSFKERVTLLVSSVVGLFLPSRIVSREMDRYTESPSEYTEELRRVSPTLARVLLDDRNEHMADRLVSLRQRGFGRMAVVVGDAHLEGLRTALVRRGLPSEVVRFSELRAATAPSPGSS
ncbi:MAG: TraB/GumN family protein [Thermoplasmata archaeon]